jgi:hypothetical protein
VHEESDGYEGPVTVLADGREQQVHAALAARFDPLAGHVVWTGRVAADLPPRAEVVLETPHGRSAAQVTERDVWGNARVTGVGRPPFLVELLDS